MEQAQWTKDIFVQVFQNTFSSSKTVADQAHQRLYTLQNSPSLDFGMFTEVIQSPELPLPVRVAAVKLIFSKLQREVNNSLRSQFPDKHQVAVLSALEAALRSLFESFSNVPEMRILRGMICRVLCVLEIIKIKSRQPCFLDVSAGDIQSLPGGFFEFFFEFSGLFEAEYFDRKIKLHVNAKLRQHKQLLLGLFRQASELFLTSPSASLLEKILQFIGSLCSLKTDLLGDHQFVVFLFSLAFVSASHNQSEVLTYLLDNCVPDLGGLSEQFRAVCPKVGSLLADLPLPDDLLQSLLSHLELMISFSEFSSEMLVSNAHAFVSTLLPALGQVSTESRLSVSLLAVHLYLGLQQSLTLLEHSFKPVNMLNVFVQNLPYILYFRNRVSRAFFLQLDLLVESLTRDDFYEFTLLFETLKISIQENHVSFDAISKASMHLPAKDMATSANNQSPSLDKSHESFLLFDSSSLQDFFPALALDWRQFSPLHMAPVMCALVKHFLAKLIVKAKVSTPDHLDQILSQLKRDKESATTDDQSEDSTRALASDAPPRLSQPLTAYTRQPRGVLSLELGLIDFSDSAFVVGEITCFRKEFGEICNFLCKIIEIFEQSSVGFVEIVFDSALRHNLALVNQNKLSRDAFITSLEACVMFLKQVYFRYTGQDLTRIMSPLLPKVLDSLVELFDNPLLGLSAVDLLLTVFSDLRISSQVAIPINALQILYRGFESPSLVIRSIRAFNAGKDLFTARLMASQSEAFRQFAGVLLSVLQKSTQRELDPDKSFCAIPHHILVGFFANVLSFFLKLRSLNGDSAIFGPLVEFSHKVLSHESPCATVCRLQVQLFNTLFSFARSLGRKPSDLRSTLDSVKDKYLLKHLQLVLNLLSQTLHRKPVLKTLQEFLSNTLSESEAVISSILEFFKQALSQSLGANSDLLECFGHFLVVHKHNPCVHDWLQSSLGQFCSQLLVHVCQSSLLPPLKFLLGLLTSPHSTLLT